jgi:molecular chaperone HscB
MDNYFAFFEIEEQFFIDEVALRKRYQDISRTNHPDYFIENEDKYEEALRITSICNAGYKALARWPNRIPYLLKLNGLLEESGNTIPQDFLMQMMDINESLMDLQMDFDADKYESVSVEWSKINEELSDKIEKQCMHSDSLSMEDKSEVLKEITDLYLKQKYLLRIKETLDKFAIL